MRQQYRLESITLRDVGVFEHTHFDFPQIKSEEKDAEKAEIHIFTGPNGCGKSTLLYALAAVFQPDPNDGGRLVRKRYRGENSSIRFIFYQEQGVFGVQNMASPDSVQQIYNTDGFYYAVTNGVRSVLWRNVSYFNHSQEYSTKKFDFAAFAYSGNRDMQSSFNVSAIQNITNSPFESSLSFGQTVRPQVLTQWIANNRTQAALARADGEILEAEHYDLALLRISQFIRNICSLDVSFQLKRLPLEVIINMDGLKVTFDALPEGLKSIICWISDLALRLESIPWQENRDIFSQPIILFLDEVDIHLHPKWQRRILPAIQKLLPNAQVFVSTHSPFVVGSVEDAFVYRLPDPQRTVCRDPASAEVITPTPSAAGKSYQLILDEVFGIEEQFDVETEALLEKFYQLKKAYLSNPQDDSQLVALAAELSSKGSEVATIVSMELRQITRLMKKG